MQLCLRLLFGNERPGGGVTVSSSTSRSVLPLTSFIRDTPLIASSRTGQRWCHRQPQRRNEGLRNHGSRREGMR